MANSRNVHVNHILFLLLLSQKRTDAGFDDCQSKSLHLHEGHKNKQESRKHYVYSLLIYVIF